MFRPAKPSNPAPPGPSSLATPRERLRPWLLAIGLGLVTIALYWPITRHSFLDYDDDLYVTSNLHVQQGITWENVKWVFCHSVSGNWHPLTMLSHMLDCQLYGLQPWGHHLTSLCLQALNTVLVYLLLRRLTGADWRSACVAALFGCHPLHVESVAWVAERKDVLSTCFGLLALLAYAKYVKVRDQRSLGHLPPSIFYLLSLACFALGLMSKPMLVTWPCLMLLLDYWPLGRLQPGRWLPLWLEKIPFFALSAAVSGLTFAVQQRAGALKTLDFIPLALRCENALLAYCRYLGKLVWPVDLAVFYPYASHLQPGWVVLAGLLLGGLTVFFWQLRRRYPFCLVGWFWFVGTLIPVIGLVQVGIQAMADRYAYIPSVGWLLLVVWGAHELIVNRRHGVLGLSLAAVAALLFFAAATRHQLGYWQNSETLFRHALAVTADNEVAHNNLGIACFKDNQTNAAISEFQAALRLKPDFAEAHNNLGNVLVQRGDTDAAITQYREAIRLDPDLTEAYNNLGTSLIQAGQTNAAGLQFQEAIRHRPDYTDARYNLAMLLATQGQTNEAIRQFQELLRLNPGDAGAAYHLANELLKSGHPELAVSQFQAALRFKPDYPEAHFNLGLAFLKQGRSEEASSQFQTVIRLSPGFAPAHYYLAVMLAKAGHADEAIAEFQAALRLKPQDALAHDKLGIVLGDHGRLDEAISEFQAALRLKPNFAEASNNLQRAQALKSGAPESR